MDYQLIDKSRAGSSNYRIYRKAFDNILLYRPNVVIVCLTHWTRSETGGNYGSHPGKIYQHLSNNDSKETEYVFRNFFNGYKNYTDMLRMIISLQTLSTNIGIDCYFLDTFSQNLMLDITLDDFKEILKYNMTVFDNSPDQRIDEKFETVKTLTEYINQTTFISSQSYQTIIADCNLDKNHPVQDGHKKISETIIDFLKRNNHGN
jgi:hypothetical protein